MRIAPLTTIRTNNFAANKNKNTITFQGKNTDKIDIKDLKTKRKALEHSKSALHSARILFSKAIVAIQNDGMKNFASIKEDGAVRKYKNSETQNDAFILTSDRRKIQRVIEFDPEYIQIFSIEETNKRTGRKDRYIFNLNETPVAIIKGCKKSLFSDNLKAKEIFEYEDGKLKGYYKGAAIKDSDGTYIIIKSKKHVSFDSWV